MQRTIFSEKHDYLLIVVTLALMMWAFYGTLAGVIAGVIAAAVANLQPIQRAGLPKNSSALLAASVILLLSIFLKIYGGGAYCYALFGPEHQMLVTLHVEMPCLSIGDFYQNVGQPDGLGFVRDLGLPVAGLLIGLLTVRSLRARDATAPASKALRVLSLGLVILLLAPPVIHLTLGGYIRKRQEQSSKRLIDELEQQMEAAHSQ